MPNQSLQDLRPPPSKPIKKNRMPGVIFVVVLHFVMIYALYSGLAEATVGLIVGDLETTVVAETAADDTPPPPPPPDFKPPPPSVPPPEVVIDLAPIQQAQNTIVAVTDRPAPPPPPVAAAPPPPPPTPATRIDRAQVTEADYPPISLRLQEQGVVEIKCLIGTDGMVKQTELVKSSGHNRLDEAAANFAKRRFRYKPATQDGMPVDSWITTRVTFRLQ
jgi:protein TonB